MREAGIETELVDEPDGNPVLLGAWAIIINL
jgi:hypothetical protein